ncbi:hypothetical protein T06_6270 [Trichinella sp. T6]|nr:hypothetical protein T06_6270 [Trichinella sp. T6]
MFIYYKPGQPTNFRRFVSIALFHCSQLAIAGRFCIGQVDRSISHFSPRVTHAHCTPLQHLHSLFPSTLTKCLFPKSNLLREFLLSPAI